MRVRASVSAFLVPLALSGLAHADPSGSREVAARVTDQWQHLGATAKAAPTRFLFEDETAIVELPPPDGDHPCLQVALIGGRGISFRARLADAPMDPLMPPEPNARGSSTAGVLELRRCEAGRDPVRAIVLTSESGRGAVEIIAGYSDKAMPPLATIIPERTGGVIPPPPEAGALPPLATQQKRAADAEVRARRDGALSFTRVDARAVDDGTGEEDLELEEGCHRIEVFAHEPSRDRPGRRWRLDLDAELRDGDQVLARDRTEAPDARLETCVGSRSSLSLVFAGAPPRDDVLVTRGTWPLPARLPAMWGPAARSKMARVMFLRHVAVPADNPVFIAQGSSGLAATPIPLSVEPGACYVAVVGVARGRARQLQLRAIVGARESTDERGAAEEGALSAFCVRAHESARLEVSAKGVGLSWALAMFRVKSGAWEAVR